MKNLVLKRNERKKILFVLPSLLPGGSERVFSFVSQKLNREQFEVKLLILGFKKDVRFETKEIEVEFLNKTRLIFALIGIVKVIWKYKPNVVMSTISHVNILMGILSLFIKNVAFIGREASVLTKMKEYSKINTPIYQKLIRTFYPKLTYIICQSHDMRNDFIRQYKISNKKLVVINNPITITYQPINDVLKDDVVKFITIGRLSEEKGYLRILEGISKIRNFKFSYTIVGSGPLFDIINQKVIEFNLASVVRFIPYTSSIPEILSRHHFFLQGSFVEGFPNALLESCYIGTPVIAFNCPGGTKEIVENGLNGFLVKDQVEFESTLRNLKLLKSIDRSKTRNSVYSKFHPSKIIKEYEELLSSIK